MIFSTNGGQPLRPVGTQFEEESYPRFERTLKYANLNDPYRRITTYEVIAHEEWGSKLMEKLKVVRIRKLAQQLVYGPDPRPCEHWEDDPNAQWIEMQDDGTWKLVQ